MRYVKTLHVLESVEAAMAFNADCYYTSEIYARDYAIAYGALPQGMRYELAIIKYKGTRNSKYEQKLAEFQRNEVTRGFEVE